MVFAVLGLTVLSSAPSKQPTSNPASVSSSNTSSFKILETNVSLTDAVGCMVLEYIGHTCPTVMSNPFTTPSAFNGVELISYQGTDYYAGNFSGIGGFY